MFVMVDRTGTEPLRLVSGWAWKMQFLRRNPNATLLVHHLHSGFARAALVVDDGR